MGALPTLLAWAGVMPSVPTLQAFGWGLWLPGAGFVAVGGWALLLFPLTLWLFRISLIAWTMIGMLAAPIAVWLIAAVLAGSMAGSSMTPYAPLLVTVLTLAAVLKRIHEVAKNTRRESALGARRASYLDEAIEALDAVVQPRVPPAQRELDVQDLRAARYLFDLALQPVGEFEGFTQKDNFQLAALRYQLNYISYGLASLQCKYTPNFHGYLNRAQRFAIESLTLPRVCGYWKLESLWGSLKWHPDPIGTRDNVMLTGWSLIALSTYAANTGDLRYQQPGALQFRPFKKRPIAYGHDTHSFTRSVVTNWSECALYLYPCEPFWSFPICNTLAFCGVVPYDRVNATDIAMRSHAAFIEALESEFMMADGNVRSMMSTLTGWISLTKPSTQIDLAFMLWMARAANAVHAGYAKRWYALARHEYLLLDSEGNLGLRGIEWDQCFDTGNYAKTPGFVLANIALAAREHGDDAMAEAALRKADELLARIDDQDKLAYKNISTGANLNLATARWTRREDWHDLVVQGPDPDCLKGPILSECAYPDVLVARAVSDGAGLELVLYNGAAPSSQPLRIERLQPGLAYSVSGANELDFVADDAGTALLTVPLDGRTEVRIQRRSAALQ